MCTDPSCNDIPDVWRALFDDAPECRRGTALHIPCAVMAAVPWTGEYQSDAALRIRSCIVRIPRVKNGVLAGSLIRSAAGKGLQIRIEEEDSMETRDDSIIQASVYLGDLQLSFEDIADLAPGIELHCAAPKDWKVVITVGNIPVASGKIFFDSTGYRLAVEETFA